MTSYSPRADFASDEVYSVLQAFRTFLKSIDMRTVAVRPQSGEDWRNLVTSVTISEKTVDEVRNEHGRLPKLVNSQIALFFSVVPFDLLAFEGFARGDIGDSSINASRGVGISGIGRRRIITRQFNPLKLKMKSTQRRLDGALKCVLSATANADTPQARMQLWDIVHDQDNEAKRLNYPNIFELIGDALRIEISPRDLKDFECTISDLARIRDVIFCKPSFIVEIEKISGLRDLQLNLIQKRGGKGGFFSNIWRQATPIDESEPLSVGKTHVVKKSLEPPSLSAFDLIELRLIHRPSALTLDETYRRTPLQYVVEPFLKVLDAFCPIDKFKKMLLEPEKCGKEPQKIFENAVTWLLSLAGFHTLYLGRYDVLRAKESSYEIGSADIIAYEDNERLLLVDCDIGSVDEKKIQKLVETRQQLESIIHNGEIRFVPVLFSPRAYEETRKNTQVTIVDKAIIESIIEKLAKGDRESARAKI